MDKHTYKTMIIEAIIALNARYGSSRQAIYNYLIRNFPNVNINKCKIHAKPAIKRMIYNGILVQCARSLKLSPQFKLTKEYKLFINSSEIAKNSTSPSEINKNSNGISESAKISTSPSEFNEDSNGISDPEKNSTSPSEFNEISISPSESSKNPNSDFKVSYSKYQYYVIRAIKALKDRNGTSIIGITKWILANIKSVYVNAQKVLRYGVKPLIVTGHLYKIKNSYKINKTRKNLIYFDTDVICGKMTYIERESTPFIPNKDSFKIGTKSSSSGSSIRYTSSKYQKVVYNILEYPSSKNGINLETLIFKATKVLGQNDKFVQNKINYLGIDVLLKHQDIVYNILEEPTSSKNNLDLDSLISKAKKVYNQAGKLLKNETNTSGIDVPQKHQDIVYNILEEPTSSKNDSDLDTLISKAKKVYNQAGKLLKNETNTSGIDVLLKHQGIVSCEPKNKKPVYKINQNAPNQLKFV